MRLILALMLILLTAACGADSESPTNPPAPTDTPTIEPTVTPEPTSTPPSNIPRTTVDSPSNQAYIRLIHAAPGIETINVEIQGLTVASRLSYGVVTGETPIEAGDYMVTISAIDDPESLILQQRVGLNGGDSTLLLLLGTQEAPDLRSFTHDNAPLDADETRLRFINAFHADLPSIRIQQDGTAIVDSLAFTQQTGSIVTVSEPTTFVFQTNEGQTLIEHPINLRGRNETTLVLVGTPEMPRIIDYSMLTRGASLVRMINTSPNSDPVDIYLNDELFAGRIGSSRASERREIAAQTYDLSVYPAGANPNETTPLATTIFTPQLDDATTGVLFDLVENLQIAQIIEDLDPIRPELTRIQFMNVAPGEDNVNISLPGIATIPGLPDFLGFGRISQPVELPVATYTIASNRRTEGDFGRAIEIAENLEFERGRTYLYFITGQETPMIFSEPVDVLEDLAGLPLDVQPSPTPRTPTLLRLVNAIEGDSTINLSLNDEIMIAGVEFGEESAYTIVSAGSQLIEIVDRADESMLVTLDYTFDTRSNYTAFIYGQADEQPEIIVVEDPTSNDRSDANVRLVNLTPDEDISFQLGYSVASGSESSPELSLTDTGDQQRPNVPAGINLLTAGTPGGSASNHLSIPVGRNNLIIIDSTENTVAARFSNLSFEPGTLYDIIIYQDIFTIEVRGFILDYTLP